MRDFHLFCAQIASTGFFAVQVFQPFSSRIRFPESKLYILSADVLSRLLRLQNGSSRINHGSGAVLISTASLKTLRYFAAIAAICFVAERSAEDRRVFTFSWQGEEHKLSTAAPTARTGIPPKGGDELQFARSALTLHLFLIALLPCFFDCIIVCF